MLCGLLVYLSVPVSHVWLNLFSFSISRSFQPFLLLLLLLHEIPSLLWSISCSPRAVLLYHHPFILGDKYCMNFFFSKILRKRTSFVAILVSTSTLFHINIAKFLFHRNILILMRDMNFIKKKCMISKYSYYKPVYDII